MLEILKKKPLDKILEDAQEKEGGQTLKRVLSAIDLTAIGIGCIIGTGIFVLTGVAAVKYAGPGIMISFVISGLACVFAALCYAEFASLVPIAGSAYTYGYATLGEIFAWIIGWDLILEYAVSAGAVAIGWSGYFTNLANLFLERFNLKIPVYLTTLHSKAHPEGFINLPAAIIVLVITGLLVLGIQESAKVNSVIVAIKVTIALLFIGIGIFHVNPDNWKPLIPNFVPRAEHVVDPLEMPVIKMFFTIPEGFGGWPGIFTAAAIIFFAYIGFDAVSTTAEEARNPQRDLPIGIIASLLICTVLYIAMSAVFTGLVRCDGTLTVAQMGTDEGAPMVYAFKKINVGWIQTFASGAISIGAICGITSVLLVTLLGQSRVFFSMARDKLLPPIVSKIHPKYKTPYLTTIVTGVLVAISAAVTPIEIIAELANIGTLFAFVIVCTGLFFLRRMKQQEGRKVFKTPGYPIVPILGVLFSLFLMLSLPIRTWYRFFAWLVLGLTIYICYSYFNSSIRDKKSKALQAIVCAVTGLIYFVMSPFLIGLFEPLMTGKIPAIVFIWLITLVTAFIGIWQGEKALKTSNEESEQKNGKLAVGIGLTVLILAAGFVWAFALTHKPLYFFKHFIA